MKKLMLLSLLFIGSTLVFSQSGKLKANDTPELKTSAKNDGIAKKMGISLKPTTPKLTAYASNPKINESDKKRVVKELNLPTKTEQPKLAPATKRNGVK